MDGPVADLLEDTAFMAKFNAKDPNILRDLVAHRAQDDHKLLKRCVAILKDLAPVQGVPDSEVKRYLECLVYCYFQCSDSIKISRTIEKLWQPYLDVYASCIHNDVEGHVTRVVQSGTETEAQSVVKVSLLLEQSRLVQQAFHNRLELVVDWLAANLCSLAHVSPHTMLATQSQLLYSFVKICVQMFQVCPSQLGLCVWRGDRGGHGVGDSTSPLYRATRDIVENLVHILRTKGYHTDCVLLCGTATALMLNTAPDVHAAVTAFDWLLGLVLDPDAEFIFTQLPTVSKVCPPCDIQSRLRRVSSSHMGVVSLIRGIVACGSQDILLATTAAKPLTCHKSDLLENEESNTTLHSCNSTSDHTSDIVPLVLPGITDNQDSNINCLTTDTCHENEDKLPLPPKCVETPMDKTVIDTGGEPRGKLQSISSDIANVSSVKTVSYTTKHRVEEITMKKLFEYIRILCEGDITLHYHAFQILLLWYSRQAKLTSSLESLCMDFTSILESTLHLVQLNWDSPVEDVPVAVVEVFSRMTLMWDQDREGLRGLQEKIMEKILNTNWYIKGRYRILAVLLQYVDSTQMLRDCPVIQDQLLQCLSTNHLASSATAVYKAFLTELQKVPAQTALTSWMETWLPVIAKGLVSNDSLLRFNMSLHWVPATLRQLAPATRPLQVHISQLLAGPTAGLTRTRALHAWVVVARNIRMLLGTADLADPHVKEALYSSDEGVRSTAMSLVCTTVKKAECVSAIEVSLLKETLPHNIKVDSAPFRQYLGSDLRKLLVRLRDSCVPLLKLPAEHSEILVRAVEFVYWLHGLCVDCLLPGACYQRRRASLDLLQVLYDTLIYRPDSRHRKGFTPETAVTLVQYATDMGHWDFFCRGNMTALLHCLLDSSDEIQSSAAALLSKYYSWPLEEKMETPPRCCHLLAEALKLCNSPNGHESHSGAILCKLVFQKYCVDTNVRIDFQHDGSLERYMVTRGDDAESGPVCFLQNLITEIQWCQVAANNNMVDASKRFPIHGFTCAITKCLTETEDLWVSPDPLILEIVYDVVAICQEITDSMLTVMASVAGQEASPSFAEIGLALETLLEEQCPDYTGSTAVTPEYQYLLSWCWNNIKESCVSMAELTWSLIMAKCPLRVAIIEDISRKFLTVLTKCRHKGVIEACRSAYIRFCAALFRTSDPILSQLPSSILSQVLTNLKENAMSSSVTRQSAGLPIIIQAVLVSEHRTKKNVLLTLAITDLFEIASLPLNTDSGLTDLPQVHGLNMLHTLFSDASLSTTVMGHVMKSVILVIQKFGSPSWAIRNAATKFFSTLVTRIFGQRSCTEGMTQNSVTFQEFSAYYPELPAFISASLTTASQKDIKAIDQIHPELFPVLTLLSCLKPMDTNDSNILRKMEEVRDKVNLFLASPVYQLRHLVAGALVAMVAKDDRARMAVSVVQDVLEGRWREGTDVNRLHGSLLWVDRLLDHIDSDSDLNHIWNCLQSRWALVDAPCMVAAQYLKTMNKIADKSTSTQLDPKKIHVLETLVTGKVGSEVIGHSLLCEQGVKLLCRATCSDTDSFLNKARVLLLAHSVDTRQACIEQVGRYIRHGRLSAEDCRKLQILLCSALHGETYVPNLTRLLELVTQLYGVNNHLTGCVDDVSAWLDSNRCTMQKHTSMSAAALPARAIVVQYWVKTVTTSENKEELSAWCRQVWEDSQVTNETMRQASARALSIAGNGLLELGMHTPDWLQPCVVNLMIACLTLIQDEDTTIRRDAADFVSSLHWTGKPVDYPSLHSNVGYDMFLAYIAENYWQSVDVVQFLIGLLYTGNNLQNIVEEKTKTRFQQLFDQEDNSFFAERIYNSISVHRTLKSVVNDCITGSERQSLQPLLLLPTALCNDLDYLLFILDGIEAESVINICVDSTVLAAMVGLVFLGDVVVSAVGQTECGTLKHKLQTVVHNRIWPTALRQLWQGNINCAQT